MVLCAVLIDGVAGASLAADDRGLAYGDGLFETIAVWEGRVLAVDAHLDRLGRDAVRLGIEAPDPTVLATEIAAVAGNARRGVVKLILTRGSGGRGYRPAPLARPRRIVALHPWPADLDATRGLRAFVCRHRLSLNVQTAGIKHLNRLDQVLASAEWPDPSYFEGLMLDPHGHVIEGTRSNLFALYGTRLVTPDLGACGVDGIVRQAILSLASRCGLAVEIRALPLAELGDADEIFLSNSVIGLRALALVAPDLRPRSAADDGVRRLAAALREQGVIP